MRIVQLTTDNRNQHQKYELEYPYFGTAPEALFQGFATVPDVEIHVVTCTSTPMKSPTKLAPNIHFHSIHVPKIGWGRSLFLGCAWATRRLIREINPDIVHGQGTERDCSMEAVLSGYPNVLTIHGNMRVHASRKEQARSLYYKMSAILEAFSLQKTDGVVAISTYTKNLVENLTPKTWLVPNAVDQRYFSVGRSEPGIPTILFVGAICERKNPIGLIKACEPMLRSGKCRIVIAGNGEEGGAYWLKFSHLLTSVPGIELLGFIDRESLGRQLTSATLLVLPTFEDNCPMVVLEAMAAGVAVAASRVGGVPDLIEDGVDGLLFDPTDLPAMRNSIERLVEDSPLREAIAAAGKAKAAARFHPRAVADEHIRIYREILGGASPPSSQSILVRN